MIVFFHSFFPLFHNYTRHLHLYGLCRMPNLKNTICMQKVFLYTSLTKIEKKTSTHRLKDIEKRRPKKRYQKNIKTNDRWTRTIDAMVDVDRHHQQQKKAIHSESESERPITNACTYLIWFKWMSYGHEYLCTLYRER